MVYIYVLKLTSNKYYVGKTTNPSFRLKDHFSENGSSWTKIFKPIKLHELRSDCDSFDEDKITLQYIKKYGIDNVRGGSFCQYKLTKTSKETINRMINGSTDKCYKCGEAGHFANSCTKKSSPKIKKVTVKTYKEVFACDYCGKEFSSMKGARYHENIYCKFKKLSSLNEYSSESEEESDEEYSSESEEESDDEYEESPHMNVGSRDRTIYDSSRGYVRPKSYKSSSKKSSSGKCYRCGRAGHFSSSCYASKHVKGYYL
jgi:cellular nucleic acid-binding protein